MSFEKVWNTHDYTIKLWKHRQNSITGVWKHKENQKLMHSVSIYVGWFKLYNKGVLIEP